MSTALSAQRWRLLWLALGACLVALAVWFSLLALPPQWAYVWGEQALHAAVYGVLVFWFGQLYPGAVRQGLILLLFFVMGTALELTQTEMQADRRFDPADIMANGVGGAAGWLVLRTPAGRSLGFVERLFGRVRGY